MKRKRLFSDVRVDNVSSKLILIIDLKSLLYIFGWETLKGISGFAVTAALV